MSEPHAAIVLSQLAPARRVHRGAARRSPSATTPRSTTSACGRCTIPADAHCNYYKYIAFLPDGIDRTALKQHAARGVRHRPLGRGLRHAAAPPAGLRGSSPTARCPGAECICARHICLPLVPVAHRERRRLRRRVAGDRARPTSCESGEMSLQLSNGLIAVTGGSGFIGSHVVDALLGAGLRRARPRPEAAARSRTSSGPTSTCSTRTRSPTRSRTRRPCSTSRPWPT